MGDSDKEEERKVALSDIDIAQLAIVLYTKQPDLLNHLKGFLNKIQESPNEISRDPLRELENFTSEEKTIYCYWLVYCNGIDKFIETEPPILDDSSVAQNSSVAKKYVMLAIDVAAKHALIKDIIDLMNRMRDWIT